MKELKHLLTVFLIFVFLSMFSFSANAQYTKLFDFTNDTVLHGYHPYSSLTSDGTFLFGMIQFGGMYGFGDMFKIKKDGTAYSAMINFSDTVNGGSPVGSLYYDGTYLYGMTGSGVTSNRGTIFKIKPDGTGYFKLHDFTGPPDGSTPNGTLISDGTFLYGMTQLGGTIDSGTIFKIKPDGTGYLKLLDFMGIANGREPSGDFIFDGTFLYGMTQQGGTYDKGIIFKIKPDGSGFSKLLEFNGANGAYPFASLISDGAFLYGMTWAGGAHDLGIILKIKPDGTGYSDLMDFSGISNGRLPNGSLISDGTFLYGMASLGGLNDSGLVFKIKPDGTSYSDLFDFAGVNGSTPTGSLISDGTFLYGMTSQGGTGYCMNMTGCGTIFKLGIANNIEEYNSEVDFIVSPNPTSGKFQVSSNKYRVSSIEICNIYGECIHRQSRLLSGGKSANQQSDSYRIELDGVPNGIYLLQINTEQGTAMRKIVVHK